MRNKNTVSLKCLTKGVPIGTCLSHVCKTTKAAELSHQKLQKISSFAEFSYHAFKIDIRDICDVTKSLETRPTRAEADHPCDANRPVFPQTVLTYSWTIYAYPPSYCACRHMFRSSFNSFFVELCSSFSALIAVQEPAQPRPRPLPQLPRRPLLTHSLVAALRCICRFAGKQGVQIHHFLCQNLICLDYRIENSIYKTRAVWHFVFHHQHNHGCYRMSIFPVNISHCE